ncbi:MAG TPA: CDP-alcohol phosphatidyltransferase family protein [Egibacteraceae bacterium]|nr:CDP-alcohol phosphatidyltransferase family protein [Egibacteraceae bacterium]
MAINAYARGVTDRFVLPLAKGLVRLGATANAVTLTGLGATLAGVAVVLAASQRLGAVILALATLTDAFDGTVARLRGEASKLGAFSDSVADRIGEAAIFGAIAWLLRDDALFFGLAITAFAGAQITSYIRAKAESLGWQATVGLVERPERMMVVVPALFFDVVPLAAAVLAAGTLITVAQRVRAVIRQASAP